MDITIGRIAFYAFGAVLASSFVYYVDIFIEKHPFPKRWGMLHKWWVSTRRTRLYWIGHIWVWLTLGLFYFVYFLFLHRYKT